MVAGGMESMSNVPFLVGRDPPKYGGHTMEVGYWGTKTVECRHKLFFYLMELHKFSFAMLLENVTVADSCQLQPQ